jgi:peptide/nickel transport system permease protein
LLQLGIVLLLVTMFTAALISLVPGDPTVVIIPFGTQEQRDALAHDLHLDEPLYQQYAAWLNGVFHGNLGCYYGTSGYSSGGACGDPVSTRLKASLPISLLLMFYAQILSLAVAIPLGVITAYKAGSKFDKATNSAAFALLSIPNFVLALVLAYYVGVKLHWVNPTGYIGFRDDPVGHFKQMALPVICLAVGQIAVYLRLLRSDMIATLQEDFVTMAKAKGMRPGRILWRHALRPSSLTLLTVAGLNVGTLIGGAVVIETIFGINGMGYLVASAIATRQYVALQSYVAVLALGYVVVNFLVDIVYVILDPRIRHARAIA